MLIESVIEWPAPPYFSFAESKPQFGEDGCQISLNNGSKIVGELLHFSPDESTIVVLPKDRVINKTIKLDEINSIQIINPQQLNPDHTFLKDRADELFPPSEKLTYMVEFLDSQSIVGYTLGYINTDFGLYIYPVTKGDKVTPCFIPRRSLKSYKIGQKIGEILVEDKKATPTQINDALKQQNDLRQQRIGDYLYENEIISTEQLEKAIEFQQNQPILRLGEALLQLELINQQQLETALLKQKDNRKIPLGRILVDMGVIDEHTLKGAMAKKLGIPYVSLAKFNFDLNAIRLIKPAFAKKQVLIPLFIYQDALVVAFEDPMNIAAIEEIRFNTQMKLLPAMASKEDILTAIEIYYGSRNLANQNDNSNLGLENENSHSGEGINDLALKLFGDESDFDEISSEPVNESDNALVQLVNKMILDAYAEKASDIHIESYPDKKNTVVRFRKDGSLAKYLEIPSNFRNAFISRIKIMSQLDISERRKPQDGKMDFKQFGPANIELRVATIPTANGLEDIVMRILASAKPVPVDKLGIDQDKLEKLKLLVQHPYGLILVCGPTGSGKTTTLHSLLGHINTPDRKIWTAEDPVEITQQGLRQVQVNSKIGWTFAAAMRSFLRADPDVIMVGEMRDQETTKIGIEASLTGHLVLSTLHTNSAPESITRMLDLGMDPFNFADALLAILAQRLTKTLCPKCKEAYTPDEQEIEELAEEYILGSKWNKDSIIDEWKENFSKEGKFTLYRSKGCPHCNKTGYKGRMGLYEFMTINPRMKHLIQTRAPITELVHEALESGMRTLKQDGISKVMKGHTDIGQVRAVCV